MVGTLKPYLLQKNLFELFALTGSRDTKTLGPGASARIITHAPEPPGETYHFLHDNVRKIFADGFKESFIPGTPKILSLYSTTIFMYLTFSSGDQG